MSVILFVHGDENDGIEEKKQCTGLWSTKHFVPLASICPVTTDCDPALALVYNLRKWFSV